MATPAVVDDFGSDALANMVAHVVGPLEGGVRGDAITLVDGAGEIPGPTRAPLLLVTLREPLGNTAANIEVTVGDGPAVVLVFEAFSGRGATLGIALPAATGATPLAVTSGDATPVGVDVRFVDGVLARLLYALGSEKVRLRRAAREIAAGRLLEHSRGEALDRIGGELRVPRLRASLVWDRTLRQLVASPERERDDAYRSRLLLYRARQRPTAPALNAALDGAHGGDLSHSGYRGQLSVVESDAELAIAIKLVSPPDDTRRLEYLKYLRRTFLLPVDATELPPERPVSAAERVRAAELLANLKRFTTWPAGSFVAQATAAALDRAARCAAHLGNTTRLAVTRAQSDDGDSRTELGIGVTITPLETAALSAMAENLSRRRFRGNPPPEILALFDRMTPRSADDDTVGEWLFRACGMRTVHWLSRNHLYLSHLPVHGALLDATPDGKRLKLTAELNGGGAVAVDANLNSALFKVSTTAPSAGLWIFEANVDPPALGPRKFISEAVPPPPQMIEACRAAGIRIPSTREAIASARAALLAAPRSMFVGLRLDPAIARNIINDPNAHPNMSDLIGWMRAAGVVSVLPLFAPDIVYLVAGATDLEQATTLDSRRTQFRWLAVPLEQDRRIGTLEPTLGAVNYYAFQGPAAASQVAAIIALTPTRPTQQDLHDRVDPNTVVVDANGEQPMLTFSQYEYLMNLLDRWCPLGVTIDTRRIRARLVDLDGDGVPDLLGQNLQHTFRPFRGRRLLGARS